MKKLINALIHISIGLLLGLYSPVMGSDNPLAQSVVIKQSITIPKISDQPDKLLLPGVMPKNKKSLKWEELHVKLSSIFPVKLEEILGKPFMPTASLKEIDTDIKALLQISQPYPSCSLFVKNIATTISRMIEKNSTESISDWRSIGLLWKKVPHRLDGIKEQPDKVYEYIKDSLYEAECIINSLQKLFNSIEENDPSIVDLEKDFIIITLNGSKDPSIEDALSIEKPSDEQKITISTKLEDLKSTFNDHKPYLIRSLNSLKQLLPQTSRERMTLIQKMLANAKNMPDSDTVNPDDLTELKKNILDLRRLWISENGETVFTKSVIIQHPKGIKPILEKQPSLEETAQKILEEFKETNVRKLTEDCKKRIDSEETDYDFKKLRETVAILTEFTLLEDSTISKKEMSREQVILKNLEERKKTLEDLIKSIQEALYTSNVTRHTKKTYLRWHDEGIYNKENFIKYVQGPLHQPKKAIRTKTTAKGEHIYKIEELAPSLQEPSGTVAENQDDSQRIDEYKNTVLEAIQKEILQLTKRIQLHELLQSHENTWGYLSSYFNSQNPSTNILDLIKLINFIKNDPTLKNKEKVSEQLDKIIQELHLTDDTDINKLKNAWEKIIEEKDAPQLSESEKEETPTNTSKIVSGESYDSESEANKEFYTPPTSYSSDDGTTIPENDTGNPNWGNESTMFQKDIDGKLVPISNSYSKFNSVQRASDFDSTSSSEENEPEETPIAENYDDTKTNTTIVTTTSKSVDPNTNSSEVTSIGTTDLTSSKTQTDNTQTVFESNGEQGQTPHSTSNRLPNISITPSIEHLQSTTVHSNELRKDTETSSSQLLGSGYSSPQNSSDNTKSDNDSMTVITEPVDQKRNSSEVTSIGTTDLASSDTKVQTTNDTQTVFESEGNQGQTPHSTSDPNSSQSINQFRQDSQSTAVEFINQNYIEELKKAQLNAANGGGAGLVPDEFLAPEKTPQNNDQTVSEHINDTSNNQTLPTTVTTSNGFSNHTTSPNNPQKTDTYTESRKHTPAETSSSFFTLISTSLTWAKEIILSPLLLIKWLASLIW